MKTVIKQSDQNPALVKRLETVNVTDHLAEARLVLDASRQKSLDMLRQAQREAQALLNETRQEGYDDGFARGYEAGRIEGHQKAYEDAREEFTRQQSDLIAAMSAALEQFEIAKRDLLIAAKSDVTRFAGRVAQRVTKVAAVMYPQAAAANLEAALRELGRTSDLEVRLNPNDVATVDKFLESLNQRAADAMHVQIIADEGVSAGGCILAGSGAMIDATIEGQLDEIARLMNSSETDA